MKKITLQVKSWQYPALLQSIDAIRSRSFTFTSYIQRARYISDQCWYIYKGRLMHKKSSLFFVEHFLNIWGPILGVSFPLGFGFLYLGSGFPKVWNWRSDFFWCVVFLEACYQGSNFSELHIRIDVGWIEEAYYLLDYFFVGN